MKKIAIIGSGMMGSALAFPAIENGNDDILHSTNKNLRLFTVKRRVATHG